MSVLGSLFAEANQAYISGNYRVASITWRRAAENAMQRGQKSEWFKCLVWAAEAELHLGNYPTAIGLLLDAPSGDDIGSAYDNWLHLRLRCKITIDWRPVKCEVELALKSLKDSVSKYNPPPQDIHIHYFYIYRIIGNYSEALKSLEKAYLNSGTGIGIAKHSIAEQCAKICILQRDFPAAESWIDAVHDQGELDSGWKAYILCYQAECRIEFARARAESTEELHRNLRALDECAQGIEDSDTVWSLRKAQIGVALLDPENGDPAKSWHPARVACRQPLQSPLNIHHRYEHNLLVLDYRLACLRFASGLAPVDDQYGDAPERPLDVIPSPDATARLGKARAALAVARWHAARLDGMLECDWRGVEVDRRAAWIEAIAEALDREPVDAAMDGVR